MMVCMLYMLLMRIYICCVISQVQELVEAEEPDHVAAEAADVLYFTMTRCVAAGVGLRCVLCCLLKCIERIVCPSYFVYMPIIIPNIPSHIYTTYICHMHDIK